MYMYNIKMDLIQEFNIYFPIKTLDNTVPFSNKKGKMKCTSEAIRFIAKPFVKCYNIYL